jgi:hypothetical protein
VESITVSVKFFWLRLPGSLKRGFTQTTSESSPSINYSQLISSRLMMNKLFREFFGTDIVSALENESNAEVLVPASNDI